MLAVLVVFWNYRDFNRPKANLRRFLRQMEREGAPVFGLEICLPGQTPVSMGWSNWWHVTADPTDQMLWQKEAAFNLLEPNVPEEFTKLAWIDPDIWFTNPRWRQETEEKLEDLDIVQMFDSALWTAEDGSIELTRASVVRVPGITRDWTSHPGFAWAMRRRTWRKGRGLYPYCLSGGGDTMMAQVFLGQKPKPFTAPHLGADWTAFDAWSSGYQGVTCGFVSGQVIHEWHGTRKDRNYWQRALNVARVVHGQEIQIGHNGLLRWSAGAPADLREIVAKYFQDRKEDG